MVIELKMCRFDNVPWGFRLVGGSDFEMPLTVVKVTEGSLAEEVGLRVGDIIVRINDDPASPLSHNDAHKVISHCGNVFFLGILREEDEPYGNKENLTPCRDSVEPPSSYTPDSMLTSKSPISDFSDKRFEPIAENISNPNEETGVAVTEEEIAALMSGEAEVLAEHNIIGVNFNRIFPKPGVCMSSEVLRQLNEEATKTKLEKDKEKKKWTTFMQKPDRPIPKSKQQIEAEARAAAAYKVKIVKQPKKATSPRPPTPEKEPEPPKEEPVVEPEIEEEPPTDSEVPNLEEGTAPETESVLDKLENDVKQDEEIVAEESVGTEVAPPTVEITEDDDEDPQPAEEVVQKTEEEQILERQLADVQKQLLALSSLPSTIQATLDAVTKQLGELLPAFKLQVQNEEVPLTVTPIAEEEEQEEIVEEQPQNDTESVKILNTEDSEIQIPSAGTDQSDVETAALPEPAETVEKTAEEMQREDEERKLDDELNYKKQKIEFWNRLFNGENITRKAFREFNKGSLVAQFEKRRVNFMKYQKPEKKIDLEKSEVYKVVHHLDKDPIRGIEIRPPVVPAAEDIRNRATPISCS